ncbi:MAG: hypothetical protein ACLQMT_10655 [Candidatus Acidiferrales bacterium]
MKMLGRAHHRAAISSRIREVREKTHVDYSREGDSGRGYGSLLGVFGAMTCIQRCFDFALYPFTDISRAIFDLDAIRLAARQKPNCVSIYECYVPQIQNQMATDWLQGEEALQLRYALRFDSAAQGKHHLPVCRPPDSQHGFFRVSNLIASRKSLKSHAVSKPNFCDVREFVNLSRTATRILRGKFLG